MDGDEYNDIRWGGAARMFYPIFGNNIRGNISMVLQRKHVLSMCLSGWYPWLLIALLLNVMSCSMTLNSLYDPEMDHGATSLQKKMDSFLTKLERHTGQPQSDYSWNATFYDDYVVELRSLLLRAQSHANNEATVKRLTLMMDNLQQLRLAHEAGSLAPSTLQDTRALFNQSWQAIIEQEISKRRGERSRS